MNDRNVAEPGVVTVDALALERATLALWQQDPRLAGRDIETPGLILLFYIDGDGRPIAGAKPILSYATVDPSRPVDLYFLEEGFASFVLAGDRTTATGAVLAVNGPAAFYGAEHPTLAFDSVGAASAPGGLFVETVSPCATCPRPDGGVADAPRAGG